MKSSLVRLSMATLAVAMFLGFAPSAKAELITLNYQGPTTGPGNPTLSVQLNGTTYSNTTVGPFYWAQNQIPPNSNFPPPIATFCIELDNSQPLPPLNTNTTFAAVAPSAAPTIGNNPAKITAIQELYGRYYDFAWNDKNTFHGSVASAAFQLALWELVYDGASTKNLNAGNFQASGLGTYTTTAQNMLNSLNGNTSLFASRFSSMTALLAPATGAKSQDFVQDQLIVQPGAIPTPPAVLLAGIGVFALIGRARLSRRTPTAA